MLLSTILFYSCSPGSEWEKINNPENTKETSKAKAVAVSDSTKHSDSLSNIHSYSRKADVEKDTLPVLRKTKYSTLNRYYSNKLNSFAFGIVFNTKAKMDKGGFGFNLSYMNISNLNSLIGLGFNAAFTLFINDTRSSNFVNTTIPHNDYTDIGVQNNFNVDFHGIVALNVSNSLSLYSGVGINFLSGIRVIKSNVTNLKWNGGNETIGLFSFLIGFKNISITRFLFSSEYNINDDSGNFIIKCGWAF